jgi:hypothetical protein
MRSSAEFTRRALGALFLVVVVTASTAACAPGGGGGWGSPRPMPEYEVKVVNVNRGAQWLTPPVVAVHDRSVDVFTRGQRASLGVAQIAENGNVDPLVNSLTDAHGVASVEVAVSADEPPLAPGEETTVTLTGSWRANRLSLVSMLICTNDGFTGLDGVQLPARVGQSRSFYGQDLDAGSERNTEDFVDLVPPCQALNGVTDDDGAPGTGMSDPALAEGSVVRNHRGVAGLADLTAEAHGWDTRRPIIEVVVTRVA